MLESSQVRWFLIQSCGGGRSGTNVAQRKPRDLNLGLKGLSDYLSIEMARKAARQGGDSELNKRATLTKHLLIKESWTTALNQTE